MKIAKSTTTTTKHLFTFTQQEVVAALAAYAKIPLTSGGRPCAVQLYAKEFDCDGELRTDGKVDLLVESTEYTSEGGQ